jgi:hypothetical protein
VPPEANDRELLRQTFNTAAAQYQEARPEYPGELYAALIALAGLRPEADSLCEVGAGPGKATIPLARRGFRLAGRPDGQLRRHWGAMLHVARTVWRRPVAGGDGGPD